MDETVLLEGLASHVSNKLIKCSHADISLLGGYLGNVMFLYYYSHINPKYETVADTALGIILKFHRTTKIYSYCNGLAGFGVGLMQLEQDGFVCGANASLCDYDDVIHYELKRELSLNRHDFLHGFIGLGFYFLKRYKNGYKDNMKSLLCIVDYLWCNVEVRNGSLRWKLNEAPDKIYNISLSHGMSSTIILLCEIYKLDCVGYVYKNKIKKLIEQATIYILRQKQNPHSNGSYFPSMSLDCSKNTYSRLGWCYGDLGISICMLKVGEILNDEQIYALAIEVLRYTALYRRDLLKNQIYDASICHGASGVAMIYEALTKKWGLSEFESAVDYWRRVTIKKL